MNKINYIIVACNPDKGMKSFGSKGLMIFNNKKLLEHQICWIKNHKKTANITILSDFDFTKIQKLMPDITVINTGDINPVFKGCSLYDHGICFIDYGCLFDPSLLKQLDSSKNSTIITTEKLSNLQIGCIANNSNIEHMFFDLPKDKFCNIFYLSPKDVSKIKDNESLKRKNLLSFEIMNYLVDSGSVVNIQRINYKEFLYFNNMRQKNAISKYIKKYSAN